MDEDIDMELPEPEETQVKFKAEFSSNEVRKFYRDIRNELIENRLECIDPNSNHIEKILEKVDNTFKSVQKPREAVSDSNVLLQVTMLAKERIKNVHCAFRSFNNIEFIDKIKAYMAKTVQNDYKTAKIFDQEHEDDDSEEEKFEEDEIDQENNTRRSAKGRSKKNISAYVLTKPILKKFGSEVMNYFELLPNPNFLIGSLEKDLILSKNKIIRQKKETQRDVETVRTKIKELDANSKDNETNNTVGETERIFNILTKIYRRLKGNPVCFYMFAMHPTSFSRTIENIFYISFLVKDGFAKIYLDEHNLPVIEPVQNTAEKTNQNKSSSSSSANIQSMISLTKLEWMEIIEVFNIQTALI